MSIANQIIDQRVIGIVNEKSQDFSDQLKIKNDHGKLKSAAFVYLVANTALGLNEEDVLDGIVDGGNDFGVDAVYYDEPSDGEIAITIIQGKYRLDIEKESNFPENGIIKIIDAISALFDPNKKLTLNIRLQKRIEEIRSFVAGGAIPRVTAIAANNGISWTEVAEQRIQESRKVFLDQVEWRHIGPEEILGLLQAQKPIDTTLKMSGQAIVEPFDFRRVLIGRMSVSELANLAEQYGDRLLERNIRRYLGMSGNRVNEAVAATLRDSQQRSNFYFYNNGITIICSQFRHNALQQTDWHVQVNGLQIVNGGQTSKTVQQIAKEIGGDIGAAQVLVRIYELPSDDDDLVSAITYATNSQNPVDLRDLKANDANQKNLAQSISALGYSYRAKREEKSVSSDEFTSAVVAEAVLAVWRHRPHQARFSGRKHFGALYDIIFTPDLNGAQAIIASLILRQAENRRKRPPVDAPDFLTYGSRFVAMLVGKYLLDDKNINLERLDHTNFIEVKEHLEDNMQGYILLAEKEIESALSPLFQDRERTLQRLSATFRRADLVEDLLHSELRALPD
ncbi:AIPR family protein [Thalassospira sp. SN3W]|uniref:AIPR family protein n=1 Tax=Thalassospira sp. SN3W TaxID=3035476 RepID=UPI00311AC206